MISDDSIFGALVSTSALGRTVQPATSAGEELRNNPTFPVGALACIAIYCSISMANQMPDDAYIFLRIAQNVVHRGEWSFNPGIPVNAATSPLYGLLLSVVVALHLPSLRAPLIIASALSLSVLAIAIYRGVRSYGSVTAMLAAFVAITFPTLLRSEGMETALYLACIALTALAIQADNEYAVGVLAGLTSLGRPEGAMMIPLAFSVVWWRSGRLPWRGLVIAMIPLCLWVSFCLHVFHTIVPHTVKLKSMQSTLPAWNQSWFREFVRQLKPLHYLAPLAGLGLFVSIRDFRRTPFSGTVILYGIAQALGYSILRAPAGYFWYDAPGDLAYLLSLVLGLVVALGWVEQHLSLRPAGFTSWSLAACLTGCGFWSVVWQHRNSYPYRLSPDYIAAGRWLKQHADPSDWVAADEIGYLGVYSGLPIRDMLGLADADSVTPLQQHRWDFWLTDKSAPRFIVTHNPEMPGEPGFVDMPWPEPSLRAYRDSYHLAFTSGIVRVMVHNE